MVNDPELPDDQAVIRCARAGALTGGLVGIGAAVWFGASGGGPGIVLGLSLGLFLGLAVASGWLMLAVVADALAGHGVSGHRLRWLAALLLACFIAPPVFLRLLS